MSHEILTNNIKALVKQLEWLQFSFDKCQTFGIKQEYTPEEFDRFETLNLIFAPSIDFLMRKVFRSLDEIEYENQGTLIEVVDNAHKRGYLIPKKKLG
ncbi:MAG: hypothetical protein KKD86_03940 [Bacteroidetes bacterium]|nr:hypothetical protein [Bacteroidota bacterium]